MTKLILIGLIVLIINIPFGYWRANVKRFSLQWFGWTSYVALVTAYFLGQQFGALIIKRFRRICDNVTSCMVMDLLRCRMH